MKFLKHIKTEIKSYFQKLAEVFKNLMMKQKRKKLQNKSMIKLEMV